MDGIERQHTGARRGNTVLPIPLALIVVVVVLAAAALGTRPTTAQVCGTLEDFPCGP